MERRRFPPYHLVAILTIAALLDSSCGLVRTILSAVAARCASGPFVVNTTADLNTGECDASSCSLRNAISLANICATGETVQVPGGTYTLTIAGAGEDNNHAGDLDITGRVNIEATDHTFFDGGGIDRVFDVQPGGRLDLTHGTIQGGTAQADGPDSIQGGGGFRNAGLLSLSHCRVQNNQASINLHDPLGLITEGPGGGILSSSTLYIDNCDFEHNEATWGGAVAFVAAASSAATVFQASNSNFSNNRAYSGGGLYLSAPARTRVTQSVLDSNTGNGTGGGIYNLGSLNLDHTEVSNNTAAPYAAHSGERGLSEGGGIWNGGWLYATQVVMQGNSAWAGYAVFNNSAGSAGLNGSAVINNGEVYRSPSYDLAALYNDAGRLYLTDSTVSGNKDGIWSSGVVNMEYVTIEDNTVYGIQVGYPPNLELGSSIVANDAGGVTCVISGSGATTSYGHNIDRTGDCGFHTATDQVTDPRLLPLAMDSGTYVHPLAAGSPAIDTAERTLCPTSIPADQRGVGRPQGLGCDRGAYELVVPHALTIATPVTETAEATKSGVIQLPADTPTLAGVIQLPASTPPTPGPVTMTLTLVQNANCRHGPGTVYTVLTSVLKDQTVTLSGRNDENTWWFTVLPGNNRCWLSMVAGQPDGDPSLLPVLVAPPTPKPTEAPSTCPQYTNLKACVAAGCAWNQSKQTCH